MKKIILMLMLMCFGICTAQMKVSSVEKPQEIGKVGAGLGVWFAKIEKYESQTHILSYKDFKFQQIEEWKNFPLSAEDFGNFYNLLIENFEKMPSEDIKIELPNDIIYVNYKKSLGVPLVTLFHHPNKNPNITGVSTIIYKKTN